MRAAQVARIPFPFPFRFSDSSYYCLIETRQSLSSYKIIVSAVPLSFSARNLAPFSNRDLLFGAFRDIHIVIDYAPRDQVCKPVRGGSSGKTDLYLFLAIARLAVRHNDSELVGSFLRSRKTVYSPYIKRGLDVLFSVLSIIVTSPLMLLSALAIFLDSGSPVFFRQERIGYNGKVFRMIKFRTMVPNAEHTGSGVYSGKGDDRVTRVGRFLRALSLDELPQFFNILKGDMSLIGPRPPLTYHPWNYDQYTEEQLHMFDIRPGITGWAQINGRKAVEWHERIRLNNWYVDHVSFALDCKIFFKTFSKLLSRADNVNSGSTVDPDAD